jgi:hypothetical protein
MEVHNLAAFEGRNRKAVVAQDVVGCDGSYPAPRCYDSREIQRVRSGESYEMARRSPAADGTQLLNGFRQGVLLARKTGNEASTANLAPRLQAAEAIQHFTPRRQAVFALKEPLENNAVSPQQLPGIEFAGIVSIRIVGWPLALTPY